MQKKYSGLRGRKIILSLVLVAAGVALIIVSLILRPDMDVKDIVALISWISAPLAILVNGIAQYNPSDGKDGGVESPDGGRGDEKKQ